jgi:dipeptidyl aminopeptidase/acylaminoacyl peptidase
MNRLAAGVALLCALLAPAGASRAASVYQPRLAFHVLSTPHFRIYYHQGEAAIARRLAGFAETVRTELAARTRLPAPGVTHVVVAGQDDEANGLATPLPYRTIRIATTWPSAAELTGNTDDWLRIVFVHEYTHILQLEQGHGWATAARVLLGRSPIAFPNLCLPLWQIEGFATYWESHLTSGGRLNAGDTAAVVRQRARGGAEPLDRVNGGLVDWPGGNATYLEGAWFYDYLASRFGEQAVGEVSNVTAGRLPYLSAPAFRRVFHESLGSLWRDSQRRLAASLAPAVPAPRQLTRQGYWVSSPRFLEAESGLLYSSRDADGFPAIYAIRDDGRRPRRVAQQFGGTRLSPGRHEVFFDQIELQDNVALRSDLFAAAFDGSRKWRLTDGERLMEPDVSRDGEWLACVRIAADGARELTVFAIERGADGRPRLSHERRIGDRAANYGSPRWSPDGTRLAAERRLPHGPSEVVVVAVSDGAERVVTSTAAGRNTTPAWLPDGSAVAFTSDRIGPEFQVFAADLATGAVFQVTSVTGGASFPDVSPDGGRLIFAGVGPRGYDVFELAVGAGGWRAHPVAEGPVAASQGAPVDASASALGPARYSPLPTLVPRAWTPLADTANGGVRLGAGIAATDVLGRHHYTASALWRLSGSTTADSNSGRPDWSASYVYDRWRPAFFVSASDETSFLDMRTARGAVVPAELREKNLSVGFQVPLQKVRHAQLWEAAFDAGRNTLSAQGLGQQRDRDALRLAWAINTGKRYGRSISTEDGVSLAVTSEQVRVGLGADGNADAFTGEARAYIRPGAGHAVLALRAGYGTSSGDLSVRRRFYLGGSLPAGPLINFGSDAFRMLRGFDDSVSGGDHVAVANVEWRQPLFRVERGWGTVPLFVRTVYAAVFADTGNTWYTSFRGADTRTALGAEASIDTVLGFQMPLAFTVGAAWTRDGVRNGRTAAAAYFRLGAAF